MIEVQKMVAVPFWNSHHFDPGYEEPTRFAFFTDDSGTVVPVLYAAYSAEAAICETLVRDIPATGGVLILRRCSGQKLHTVPGSKV